MIRCLSSVACLLTVAIVLSTPSGFCQAPAQTSSTVEITSGTAATPDMANEASTRGEHNEAVGILERYLQTNAGDDDARTALARARLSAGNPDAARSAAQEVLVRTPDSTDALLIRGLAQQRLGKFEEARLDFQRVLNIAPEYCDAHYALVQNLLTDEQTSAAAEALAAVPDSCKQTSSPETAASFVRLQRRVQQAINPSVACDDKWWADRGPEPREPEDPRLVEARQFLAKNNVDGAERLVDEVLKGDTSHHDAHVLKARIELRRGKDREVEKRLVAALRRSYAYADCDARLLLGEARFRLKDLPGAKSAVIDCGRCARQPEGERMLQRIAAAEANPEPSVAAKPKQNTPATASQRESTPAKRTGGGVRKR